MYGLVKMGIYLTALTFAFIGFWLLYRNLKLREMAKDNMRKVYDRLVQDDQVRIDELENSRRVYGEQEQKGWITKLDQRLLYSRINKKHQWLSTSTFLALNLVISLVVFLLVMLFTKSVPLSLLGALISGMLPHTYLSALAGRNYSHTEQQFTLFMNMVSNYSLSSDNIVTILEYSAGYVGEPIRSAVSSAVSQAHISGNSGSCIRHLVTELEHPLFTRFVRNLEICSRSDSNFQKIIEDFRPQAESFITSAEKKKSIFKNGRNMILLLMTITLVIIGMSGVFINQSIMGILRSLYHNSVGQIILTIDVLIYLAAFWYAFFGMRR